MLGTRSILLGFALSWCAFSGPSAQQRDPNVQTLEDIPVGQAVVFGEFVLSDRALAQALLDNFDLVAVGMFDSAPDREWNQIDILKPHELTVAFRILTLYKGSPAQDEVVAVKVNSDMLVLPGGDASRYAARWSESQRLVTEIDSITARLSSLDQRREAGNLPLSEYENERARLSNSRERLLAQRLAIPARRVLQSHGDNFYTLEGAIRPGVHYLVGISRSSDDPQTYLLTELPIATRNIYWGQMAEDIAAALNGLPP